MKKITQLINEAHPHLSKLTMSRDVIEKTKKALGNLDLFKKNSRDYRITKFSQGILYVSVSTAAFATKIRHSSPLLLSTLQQNLPEITFHAIQCKVISFPTKTQETLIYPNSRPIPLNKKTQEKIIQLSKRIHSEELQVALRKLAD